MDAVATLGPILVGLTLGILGWRSSRSNQVRLRGKTQCRVKASV